MNYPCNDTQNCSSLEHYNGFHLFCILSLLLAGCQQHFSLMQLFPPFQFKVQKQVYQKRTKNKLNQNKV